MFNDAIKKRRGCRTEQLFHRKSGSWAGGHLDQHVSTLAIIARPTRIGVIGPPTGALILPTSKTNARADIQIFCAAHARAKSRHCCREKIPTFLAAAASAARPPPVFKR